MFSDFLEEKENYSFTLVGFVNSKKKKRKENPRISTKGKFNALSKKSQGEFSLLKSQ